MLAAADALPLAVERAGEPQWRQRDQSKTALMSPNLNLRALQAGCAQEFRFYWASSWSPNFFASIGKCQRSST